MGGEHVRSAERSHRTETAGTVSHPPISLELNNRSLRQSENWIDSWGLFENAKK